MYIIANRCRCHHCQITKGRINNDRREAHLWKCRSCLSWVSGVVRIFLTTSSRTGSGPVWTSFWRPCTRRLTAPQGHQSLVLKAIILRQDEKGNNGSVQGGCLPQHTETGVLATLTVFIPIYMFYQTALHKSGIWRIYYAARYCYYCCGALVVLVIPERCLRWCRSVSWLLNGSLVRSSSSSTAHLG